ncbi:uncharacterized protein LOC129589570 [Paramacrobiotus metropolitanus]|uniref:uncharacterized protein LOC129589570 n=1 Tax=Paramacrobiotus metropolitanus TaxID=2943436 RepID=UPI002445E87E|nr:uncharacterized protein LOC129589570 [Paramacrobiotus metropolitanus]
MVILTVLIVSALAASISGTPDLSAPAFSIPYNGFHIQVYNSSDLTGNPVLYYAPTGIILPNFTEVIFNNHSESVQLALDIRLWDYDFAQTIESYVAQWTGKTEYRLLPVPFKWMHLKYPTEYSAWKYVRSAWLPIAHLPRTVSMRIPCQTVSQCRRIKDSVDTNLNANWQLMFANRPPEPKKVIITVEKGHLLGSSMFTAISERLIMNQYVFLSEDDFFTLVRETIINSLDHGWEADEFLDDEQLHGAIRKLLPKFCHNITNYANFTDGMWQSTYWRNADQRPDRRAQNLNNRLAPANQSLTELVAALPPDDLLHFDDKTATVKPLRMYCVNMDKLQNKELMVFGDITVLAAKATADYSSFLVKPEVKRMNAIEGNSLKSFKKKDEVDTHNVTNEIQDINQRLESLEDNDGSVRTNLAEINAKLADLRNATFVDDIARRRIEALEMIINQTAMERLKALEVLYDSVMKNLTELIAKTENLTSASTTDFDQRLEILERSNNASRENNVTVILSKLNVTLSPLHGRLQTLEGTVAQIQVNATQCSKKADRVESGMWSVRNRIDAVESKVDNVVRKTGMVNAAIASVTKLRGQVTRLESAQSRSSDMEHRVASMYNTILPVGSIVAYPGNGTLPHCWLECNGESFDAAKYQQLAGALQESITPNLRGRFVLGAADHFPLGSEGGEEIHQLTLDEMPSHSHKLSDGAVGRYNFVDKRPRIQTADSNIEFPDATFASGLAGRNEAHNNMPPYRAI